MTPLNLALDWTPNINHIGFFVAQEQGFYQELGIDLTISDPSEDNYIITPAKKVELGLADFALCPTESIISYRTKSVPFDLIAIAAVLQEDLSAIVVKERADIQSPKDLDGKRYSSYQARYEDGIVRAMIKNDGGSGDITIDYPEKLGIWNTLLSGDCDATWIFLNWEGLAAIDPSIKLNYFKMRDFQIPYSYSPVIATCESKMTQRLTDYRNFIQATKRGYLFSANHITQSAAILAKYITQDEHPIDLEQSLTMTAPYFGQEENWGRIDPQQISTFINWIVDHQLESKAINIAELITDKCCAP